MVNWNDWVFEDRDFVVKKIQHEAAQLVLDQVVESLKEDDCFSISCYDGETVELGVWLFPNQSGERFFVFNVEDLEFFYEWSMNHTPETKSLDRIIAALQSLIDECEELKLTAKDGPSGRA